MIAVTHPFRLGSFGVVLDEDSPYAVYGSGEVTGVVGNTVVLRFGVDPDTDEDIHAEFHANQLGLILSEK